MSAIHQSSSSQPQGGVYSSSPFNARSTATARAIAALALGIFTMTAAFLLLPFEGGLMLSLVAVVLLSACCCVNEGHVPVYTAPSVILPDPVILPRPIVYTQSAYPSSFYSSPRRSFFPLSSSSSSSGVDFANRTGREAAGDRHINRPSPPFPFSSSATASRAPLFSPPAERVPVGQGHSPAFPQPSAPLFSSIDRADRDPVGRR